MPDSLDQRRQQPDHQQNANNRRVPDLWSKLLNEIPFNVKADKKQTTAWTMQIPVIKNDLKSNKIFWHIRNSKLAELTPAKFEVLNQFLMEKIAKFVMQTELSCFKSQILEGDECIWVALWAAWKKC